MRAFLCLKINVDLCCTQHIDYVSWFQSRGNHPNRNQQNNMKKYTEEEAYELALIWMPRINASMASNGQIINLASKIWSGEVTISDLEKLKK